MKLDSATSLVTELLRTKDRSAYLLSKYLPPKAQPAFLALRAFNLETIKILDTMNDSRLAKLRLEFWKSTVQAVHSKDTRNELTEPCSVLLHHSIHSLRIPIAKRYLLTMVQTRENRVNLNPFRSLQDLERLGEGTHSQMLYATIDMLHSLWPETSEFLQTNPDLDEFVTNSLAHLGQAAGVASALKTLEFYAKKHNFVNLPVDTITAANVSQQTVLDALHDNKKLDALEDMVFETATRANDHVLAARSLMKELAEATGSVPTSLALTAMQAVPTVLYLERLEKAGFDVRRVGSYEWRLPWRSYLSYKRREV